MKTLHSILYAGLVAFTTAGTATAQNLIDVTYGAGAGSFELGQFVNDGADKMLVGPGSTSIIGWTVGSAPGGVHWCSPPLHRPAHGLLSVDLIGVLPGSGLATTIPTVPGAVYTLCFSAYANHAPYRGRVSAGSLVGYEFSPDLTNPTNAVYTRYTLTFTATLTNTTVTFEPSGFNDWGFTPVIDDVSVEAVAPHLSIRCSQVELCWESLTNLTYQVQYRSSLTTNLWVDLGVPTAGNGLANCITDAVAVGQPQRFYRVVASPQ